MNKDYSLLKSIQDDLLADISLEFKRDLYDKIDWESDCIWVLWERWVWKTYMLLQRVKETSGWFYFSADSTIIKSLWLFEFVYWTYKNLNITKFFIDEIYKYSNWQQELKNIIDSIPHKNIVFTGSSSLSIFKWTIDLGRRLDDYSMYTLSFREFLKLKKWINIPSFSFENIVKNHNNIMNQYWSLINDILFQDYINQWYYPFWIDLPHGLFVKRLQKVLNRTIIEDIPSFDNFRTVSLDKITRLFYFISNIPPSQLSILSLSKKIWVDKNIVDNILYLLKQIWVIHLIPKFGNLSDRIRKEYKIFLWNPNIYFIYTDSNIWTTREAFFINAIRKLPDTQIYLPSSWDFIVENKLKTYTFEIWWKSKSRKQIQNTKNAFVIVDDIAWWPNKIPLWVFGLI